MKYAIFVFVLLLFTSCYNLERNCTDYKTGKFSFEYEIDGVKKATVFERMENIEVETFEGKTDTSTVRWINDCEYILQKKNPRSMQDKKAIHMKILSTDKNSYTFEFSIVGDANKQKGVAKKLN